MAVVRGELFFVGCGIECTHNLWCVYTLLVSIDSLFNMYIIHLNSGFQRKNYKLLFKKLHNSLMDFLIRQVKVSAIKQLSPRHIPRKSETEIDVFGPNKVSNV